jgi:hypothetical protein
MVGLFVVVGFVAICYFFWWFVIAIDGARHEIIEILVDQKENQVVCLHRSLSWATYRRDPETRDWVSRGGNIIDRYEMARLRQATEARRDRRDRLRKMRREMIARVWEKEKR